MPETDAYDPPISTQLLLLNYADQRRCTTLTNNDNWSGCDYRAQTDFRTSWDGKLRKPAGQYEICWIRQVVSFIIRAPSFLLTFWWCPGGYAEAQSRICDIRERCVLCRLNLPSQWTFLLNKCMFLYRGIVVEKMVEYMSFKTHCESIPKEEIPLNDFMERIPPEIVLELSVPIFPFSEDFFVLSNRNHLSFFV